VKVRRKDPIVPIGSIWLPEAPHSYYILSKDVRGNRIDLSTRTIEPAIVISRAWYGTAWFLSMFAGSQLVWEWESDIKLWRRVG
jgi:hypothetical protein